MKTHSTRFGWLLLLRQNYGNTHSIRTPTLSEATDQEQKKRKKKFRTTLSKTADQEQEKKKIRATTLSDQQQINNNNKKIRTTADQDPLAYETGWAEMEVG